MAQNDLTGLGEINALLGRGTDFSGKLAFDGRVRIDGKFQGEIFSDDVLIIGEGGEVRAEIEVGTLIVRGGAVWGNVNASQLIEIWAPGRVYGNLAAPQLFIDKGVIFEGQCKMTTPEGTEIPATGGSV